MSQRSISNDVWVTFNVSQFELVIYLLFFKLLYILVYTMITLAKMAKSKSLIIIASLVFAPLFALFTGPSYEVYVDIKVNPPENIRRTDFSWITVNEWFNTQAHLIDSYFVLKEVKTDIPIGRLRKMVSAKRLGNADIIRLYVRASGKASELEDIATQLMTIYLKHLEAVCGPNNVGPTEAEAQDDKANHIEIIKLLNTEKAKALKEFDIISGHLKNNTEKLEKVKTSQAMLKDIQTRLRQIEREMATSKRKLTTIRKIYAEDWHEVVSLKRTIVMLAEEKKELNRELIINQRVEDTRLELKKRITNEEDALKALKLDLADIEKRRNSLKKIHRPEEKTKYCYIINPPTFVSLPEFALRLFLGASLILSFWFIAYILYKRFYKYPD